MCWSSERTTELSRLIEVNGLDYEMTSVDLARALWIGKSLSYKWCSKFMPNRRVKVDYRIATAVTLRNFKELLILIWNNGIVRKGRYSGYAGCRVVQKFYEDEAYVVVNTGNFSS